MDSAASERTRLALKTERARLDPAFRDAVLDEGLVCHLSWIEQGAACVLPLAYVRVGAELHLHGSRQQRALAALAEGAEACVCVTLLDGLVLARSAMNHSMNYRCVVVFGRGRELRDAEEKRRSLAALVEHVAPGRGAGSREPSAAELAATRVVAIPLDEWSGKQRAGGPIDYPQDLVLAHWAGVLPLALAAGAPEPAAELPPDAPLPQHVRDWKRGR